MKCYLSLTAPTDERDVYVDLFEVTLRSAKQNTTLDLHVLYDGPEDHRCYRLMQEHGVDIIPCRFSHRDCLEKVYPADWMMKTFGRMLSYDKIAGTFMRLDIPFCEQEDEYVLYADIDVIFVGDVRLVDLPRPEYLAAAPEFLKDVSQMNYFNAGILLLNIPNMRKKCRKIFDMMERGKRNSCNVFDQGYLNQVCFNDMTLLPLEYNWKPYWGINNEAKIIHLHGMKPGGDIENSGFCMSDEVIYQTLEGHEEDIKGYIYYTMLYYDILGVDGKKWISDFIGKTTLIMSGKESIISIYCDKIERYRKKVKKYKKLSSILLGCVLLLAGVMLYVVM